MLLIKADNILTPSAIKKVSKNQTKSHNDTLFSEIIHNAADFLKFYF